MRKPKDNPITRGARFHKEQDRTADEVLREHMIRKCKEVLGDEHASNAALQVANYLLSDLEPTVSP